MQARRAIARSDNPLTRAKPGPAPQLFQESEPPHKLESHLYAFVGSDRALWVLARLGSCFQGVIQAHTTRSPVHTPNHPARCHRNKQATRTSPCSSSHRGWRRSSRSCPRPHPRPSSQTSHPNCCTQPSSPRHTSPTRTRACHNSGPPRHRCALGWGWDGAQPPP